MLTVQFLKALSDETRLRCFRVISKSRESLCVAELADILRKPQYAVSRCLSELRKSGLVVEARQGKFVFYELPTNPAVLALGSWVQEYCSCESQDQVRNGDGSTAPGAPSCEYDFERLLWRISIREQNQVVLTYPVLPAVPDTRARVLFVCVHNSARSQLAEAYLRQLAGDSFAVESAGLTPGTLNPQVVAVLAEQGIDISGKRSQSVAEVYHAGRCYQWVITVCSREAELGCPVFPGPVRRLAWPFADPAGFTGTQAQILDQVRDLALAIKGKIQDFIVENTKADTAENRTTH